MDREGERAGRDDVPELPLLPGFREMALRRMSAERRRLVAGLAGQRRSAGLSQTEVAARMGTSQSAVARLESGDADVRVSTLERYAAAIGSQLAWLAEAQPEPGRADLSQPGPSQPQLGRSGRGQPGFGQPVPGHPGPGQAGLGQPGPGRPEFGQPEPRQPGLGQPGPGQAGLGQPAPGRPEFGQPDPAEPDSAQPDGAQPGDLRAGPGQEGPR
jgi:hypothetical protein